MKKILGRLISVLAVLLCVCGGLKVCNYMLIDDSGSYTRVTMHEFYEQDNIDMLFMGASHCYRSFNPQIVDSRLGINSFNLGSSAQQLDVTFLLMEEALNRYDVDTIVVDLSDTVANTTKRKHDDMQNVYLMLDYMKPSLRKLKYTLNASNPDMYVNSFILARRKYDEILSFKKISRTMKNKSSDAYKNFEYVVRETEAYCGKGFVGSDEAITDHCQWSNRGYSAKDVNTVTDDWKTIISQMVKLCNDKGVKLIFVSAPQSSFQTMARGNYDDYIEIVHTLLEETNVDYYDFNLLKEQYWPDTSTLFIDTNHLNLRGAELFSNLFCDVLTEKVKIGDLLYSSMEEKFDKLNPNVYGVCYKISGSGNDKCKSCKLVCNKDEVSYEAYIENKDSKELVLIHGKEEDNSFVIPDDYKGNLTIKYCFAQTGFEDEILISIE